MQARKTNKPTDALSTSHQTYYYIGKPWAWMNAVIMKHRGTFISTHLRSIWWLLKTLDHSVSIKSPSMKPLEERISTHLATWGNNGGGRGGMEQRTTESLHNHMINKELGRRYIIIYIYICNAKQGYRIQHYYTLVTVATIWHTVIDQK